ncbi:MAG: hypothetical protein ACTHOD_22260 [Motilibacteraceae bacterium]
MQEDAPVPPSPWQVLLGGALLVALLAAAVLAVHRPQGPLDQRDPARQRDGLADVRGKVPPLVAGVRFGDGVVELLFLRRPADAADLAGFRRQQPDGARVLVVLPTADAPTGYLADPSGSLARAVGLPIPVDGGPGVGYAVVDPQRRVRYSTLDPDWAANAFEPAVIAGAVA